MIDWVKQLTRLRGYTDQMAEDANAVIFTFGSYRLGVSRFDFWFSVLVAGNPPCCSVVIILTVHLNKF